MEVVNLILQLMDPTHLIQNGGLWLLLAIVFSENGFFFGFFLPGDALLFMAGMFCGLPILDLPVHMLILHIVISAFLGYGLSYFTGYKFGKWILNKPDSFFFKKKYLNVASGYFEKRHRTAIVFARFIPVIRTFLPLCLGLIHFNLKSFIVYNLFGALVWASSLVLAGYFLKASFPAIVHYIEWVVLVIAIATFFPLVYQYFKHRKISINYKEHTAGR
jgi:membrane-associated protein